MMRNALITKVLAAAITTLAAAPAAHAQQPAALPYSNRFSVLAGLLQPLVLKGGNVELNYLTRRLSFEYSHGFGLDVPTLGDFKDQKLALHLPYSTGFGVGYRLSAGFDIRLEPKVHSWEIYAEGQPQTAANRLAAFRTVTLGVGAYYRYFPFRRSESRLLQGLTTSTSLRYWQNVGSTQAGNEFSYTRAETGRRETLKVPNIGIANTPIFFNIAVGYTFGGE